MSTLLLVDFSSLMWKSTAVHSFLSHRGIFTGGLYGVITQIVSAAEAVGATRLAVCADSPPYDRLKHYPGYKGDRKRGEMDEVLLKKAGITKTQCFEFFAEIGIPVWREPGFEADDMIAWGVDVHHSRFRKIVAASNDSDLYQLFRRPNFSLYRGSKGEYTIEDFYDEFRNMDPALWVELLALTGTHNGVPGIKGVGLKTALKILRDPNTHQQVELSHSSMVSRNRELIRLPWAKLPPPRNLPYMPEASFSVRKLVAFASRYGITVTASMEEAFSRVCYGR